MKDIIPRSNEIKAFKANPGKLGPRKVAQEGVQDQKRINNISSEILKNSENTTSH